MSSAKKKPLLIVLLVVFITVFIVSAFFLLRWMINSVSENGRYNNEELNDLSDILAGTPNSPIVTEPIIPFYTTTAQPTTEPSVPSDTSDVPVDSEPADTTTDAPTDTTPPEPQYSERLTAVRNAIFELQKINPDIAGYISIPLLNISYPLLSRPDDYTNSYYIDKAYDLSEAMSGSIFYDFRCDPSPMMNYNTVLYGHNMRDGSMFAALKGCYYDEKKFQNAEITIATLDGIYTFKLFSAYITDAYDSRCCLTSFSSNEEFCALYEEIKARSEYQASGLPVLPARILTLSTCTNYDTDGRYAFHAVLTRIER